MKWEQVGKNNTQLAKLTFLLNTCKAFIHVILICREEVDWITPGSELRATPCSVLERGFPHFPDPSEVTSFLKLQCV